MRPYKEASYITDKSAPVGYWVGYAADIQYFHVCKPKDVKKKSTKGQDVVIPRNQQGNFTRFATSQLYRHSEDIPRDIGFITKPGTATAFKYTLSKFEKGVKFFTAPQLEVEGDDEANIPAIFASKSDFYALIEKYRAQTPGDDFDAQVAACGEDKAAKTALFTGPLAEEQHQLAIDFFREVLDTPQKLHAFAIILRSVMSPKRKPAGPEVVAQKSDSGALRTTYYGFVRYVLAGIIQDIQEHEANDMWTYVNEARPHLTLESFATYIHRAGVNTKSNNSLTRSRPASRRGSTVSVAGAGSTEKVEHLLKTLQWVLVAGQAAKVLTLARFQQLCDLASKTAKSKNQSDPNVYEWTAYNLVVILQAFGFPGLDDLIPAGPLKNVQETKASKAKLSAQRLAEMQQSRHSADSDALSCVGTDDEGEDESEDEDEDEDKPAAAAEEEESDDDSDDDEPTGPTTTTAAAKPAPTAAAAEADEEEEDEEEDAEDENENEDSSDDEDED